MDTSELMTDPTKAFTLAQRLVSILVEFDPETRRRAIAAAQALLGDPTGMIQATESGKALASIDLATFFVRDESLKPADNAYLCAAYHFAMYGMTAFSLAELRDIAGEAGVVLPDRLDMTLKQAGKSGRKLFQSAGRDMYKPTATAGVFFKEKWNVTPGRMTKAGNDH